MASILVVEDSPVIRLIYDGILSGIHSLVMVDNAEKAMKTIFDTHYDLIFTDYNLPGMDGVDLVKWVLSRKHSRNIPIVLVSADVEAIRNAKSVGAAACMVKPIRKDKILEAVKRLCKEADPVIKNTTSA